MKYINNINIVAKHKTILLCYFYSIQQYKKTVTSYSYIDVYEYINFEKLQQ